MVYILFVFRLINGIIEFDQKLSKLPIRVKDRSPGTTFWSIIFIAYFIFYIALHKYVNDKMMLRNDLIIHFIENLFIPPRVADFMVTVTACFYLHNLGYRFIAVTVVWQQLMSRGGPRRTTSETAAFVERLRLLHAELSELLRMFNTSYGPLVLVLFVFFVSDVFIDMYYMIFFKQFTIGFAPYLLIMQNLFLVFSIVCIASWTNSKVMYWFVKYSFVLLFLIDDVMRCLTICNHYYEANLTESKFDSVLLSVVTTHYCLHLDCLFN